MIAFERLNELMTYDQDGKWRSAIKVNGTIIRLGDFYTSQEAHAAYKNAANQYFGEFARMS
jgi:uncharacterized protein YegP (UPF0339 family)